jgi:uncharacterized membrane protein
VCTLGPVAWAAPSTTLAATTLAGTLLATAFGSTLRVLADEIGESDCELIRQGLLHQPVNALSSLAYVLVGVVILGAALRHRVTPLSSSLVYAGCVAAIGIGSVLFHGPQPAGSRILHDLPILITLVFVAVHDALLVWDRLADDRRPARRPPFLPVFAGSAIVIGAAGLFDDTVRTALTTLALLAVVALEVVVFRRDLRPAESPRERGARRAFLVGVPTILASALASYALGRTGSPACDDDSPFQLHGLWHVLTSAIFGLWWWLALDRPGRREP